MGPDQALGMLNQMLWNAAIISAPVLGAILIVGLIISIFQVATQLQEMTLTFVPKLAVVTLLLIFLGSWMVSRLTQFAQAMMLSIPNLAQ
jgi:flagellar biosynthesis protein FliQ